MSEDKKHIQYFKNKSDALGSNNSFSPNVSYVEETNQVIFADSEDIEPIEFWKDENGNISPHTPFRFVAMDDNTSISLQKSGSPASISLQYSKDYKTWSTYTIGTSITLNAGEKFYFRGDNSTFGYSSTAYYYFSIPLKNKIQPTYCYGNAMDLINYTSRKLYFTSNQSYIFNRLFINCYNLISCPELPSTTLTNYCYWHMFYNCKNLTQVPYLPATRLASNCYNNMFCDCISLTQAPDLPATTLSTNCYDYMFSGCTNLTQVPDKLPATSLYMYCYNGMFRNCTSLTKAPDLPATSLADYCYYRTFYGCTNLTKAPDLPATTLINNCYNSMFYGCTKLKSINVNFTSWGTNRTTDWMRGVSGSGFTFTKPSSLPTTYGYSNVPSGATVINK